MIFSVYHEARPLTRRQGDEQVTERGRLAVSQGSRETGAVEYNGEIDELKKLVDAEGTSLHNSSLIIHH
ncbi:MAG: hypothetical protein KJ063_10795 [Anaerolineae bacterium]|nr:hypothetical protein [Anaerolineae bacterium]